MRRGFTLIELLVVVAIVGILAALIFPVYTSAKNAACKAGCVSNLKQISSAYRLYLLDNNDYYPCNDMGANLFLVEPYLGQRRFKMRDDGSGLDTTVWLCRATYGRLGLWYRVADDYWGSPQNAPWWKMGVHESTCRIYNSYCVNDDVTSSFRGKTWYPAHFSKVRMTSRTVLFGESCYNEDRHGDYLDLGTAATAVHPTKESGQDVAGWYPGYPCYNSLYRNSDLQAWHNGGANFLYVDGHVRYSSSVPPLWQWKVP